MARCWPGGTNHRCHRVAGTTCRWWPDGEENGRRRFGWVRKLSSGRHQASYLGPDGRRHVAPHTFDSATSADRWLVQVETTILRREWFDPERTSVQLHNYVWAWIEQRPVLRPRTRALSPTARPVHHTHDRCCSASLDRHADGSPVACGPAPVRGVGVDECQGVSAAARGPDDGDDGGQDNPA